MHNPYQSPASSATHVLPSTAKRPISVWLFLLLLGGVTILFATATAGSAWLLVSFQVNMNLRLAAGIALHLVMVACAVGGLVGVVRRRQWARWLGMFALVMLTVGVLVMPDTANYANATQRSGGTFGRMILFPSLMGWWIYAFGFSTKAKRYFGD